MYVLKVLVGRFEIEDAELYFYKKYPTRQQLRKHITDKEISAIFNKEVSEYGPYLDEVVFEKEV